MMNAARRKYAIPLEKYAEKKRTAEEGKLVRTLMWDQSRQRCIPAALASVDAANFYNRVNHTAASLTLQAFGVPKSAVITMLSTLGTMKFSIRTGFGESEILHGGSIDKWYHGLCQGNGAAPADWISLSTLTTNRQQRKGHVIQIKTPISGESLEYCAVLFVDDTDIPQIGIYPGDTKLDLEKRLQEAVTCWSDGLRATGGSLKHKKCYYYSIGYLWKNGDWSYDEPSPDSQGIVLPNENEISPDHTTWPKRSSQNTGIKNNSNR